MSGGLLKMACVLYPGSFDPIHNGHVELAEIASRYGFEGDLADAAITKKVLIAHIENEKTKR